MSNKTKYLSMAILMTLINIPLFIYSQSLAHRSASTPAVQEEHSQTEAPVPADATHGHESPAGQVPLLAASGDGTPQLNPADIAAAALAEQENPERFKTLANLYRPPLYGKCKKLFERFNRKNFPDKPYKSFVYSFDGESAYCADAYTDKGQQAADEIVMRDCEEHHVGSGKYSPCRIYPAE